MMTDYAKYRGKCKQMSQELVSNSNGELELVRGWYHDSVWGNKHQHWWTKKKDGTIVDPTALQFPTKGTGQYEEYAGLVICELCDKEVPEEEASFEGHHTYCSTKCHMMDVGMGKY